MRVHVRRVFKRCGSNVTEAARRLGITRNTARKYLDGCAKEKEGAG